jgi:hypothetical protein
MDLTEHARGKLESLQERTQADSMSEVIRRALAFYEVLVTASEKGSKVMVRDRQGTDKEMVLVL